MDATTKDSESEPKLPLDVEIAQRARRLFFRRIALARIASLIELIIYCTAALAFIWRQIYMMQFQSMRIDPIVALTSTETMLAFAAVFMAGFSFILNGVTPIVGLITRNRNQLEFPELQLPQLSAAPAPITFRTVARADVRTETVDADQIEENFSAYIRRSQEAARVAQRRPNALLFVGTIIAAAGLIFFVMTLPGSRYGFLDVTPTPAVDLKADLWSSMIQLLPRLLMLIFIQVLAGFFLRQYRSSMEDFRYYESVLRHREAQYLSYTLRKKIKDTKALLKFADELLKEQEFGLIAKGQSTMVLEAQRTELNEFRACVQLSRIIAEAS